MNSAKDLEKAVAALPDSELKEFRAWFTEFDSENWDVQIESDIESGKLEKFGEKALGRHLAKETSEI
jgi:hypothetical protein